MKKPSFLLSILQRCSKSLAILNIGRRFPLMYEVAKRQVHQWLYPIARQVSHVSRRYIAADRYWLLPLPFQSVYIYTKFKLKKTPRRSIDVVAWSLTFFSFIFLVSVQVQSAPNSATPVQRDWLALGNAFYDSAQYEKAAEYYQNALKAGQNIPFAWFNLGNCQAQKQEYTQALVSYRRAAELAPQWSRPWMLLGDLYFMYGDYPQAIVAYTRFIELEPDDHYALRWKGEAALKLDGQMEAQRSLEESLKKDPDQIDAYFALAESHVRLRDFEAAAKTLEDAILLSPKVNAPVYFYLGYIYEQSEQIKKAIRSYEDGLLLEPSRHQLVLKVSDLYLSLGESFMALLTLETALKYSSSPEEILLEIGNLYFKQSRYAKALETYTLAYQKGALSAQAGIENSLAKLPKTNLQNRD